MKHEEPETSDVPLQLRVAMVVCNANNNINNNNKTVPWPLSKKYLF